MEFIDRSAEMTRLQELLSRRDGGLAVVTGRRRIGKTRLLLEWARRSGGLYTVCDRSAGPVQRRYFAREIARRYRGFDEVVYPDWASLLARLTREAEGDRWRGPLVLDEFPYAVESDPALASILQNWIDHDAKRLRMTLAISGSSQRMMQGFALASDAPLYGRAAVLMDLKPLRAGYIKSALGLSDDRGSVEAYAVWGGVPRYWELAEGFGDDLESAVDRCVLDPLAPLHDEPDRLLLDESPPAVSLRPLLDVIGAGAHRITEIGARLGQPATSLARPLSRLAALGLVRRETPYGEPEKSSKRALYKIDDPFFRFWFRVVAPNRGLVAQSPASTRLAVWRKLRPSLVAETWEELCRQCVPFLGAAGTPLSESGPWQPAGRYWRGNEPEWDIVAQSLDGKRFLLGEAKWVSGADTVTGILTAGKDLIAKGSPRLPGIRDRQVTRVVFVPQVPRGFRAPAEYRVIDAATVLRCLR